MKAKCFPRDPGAALATPLQGALALCLAIALSACKPPPRPAVPQPRQEMRFGLARQSVGALAMLAIDEKLAAAERVEVRVTDYPSGVRALEALLAGEVDAVNCAEVPIVLAAFERNDFQIVATLGTTTGEERVVARKDAGIAQPADLRGKRVATQKGSAVHFFLQLFLEKHGLGVKDITLSFLPAEKLVPALVAGEIDAFSMREPYVSQAVAQLGGNTVLFSARNAYFRGEYLVVRADYLGQHRPAVVALLHALACAETLARTERPLAIRVVARRLGIKEAQLARQWDDLDLRLYLDQSLFRSLEDAARWARESSLAGERPMPNFLSFVDIGPLKEARPEVVMIIR